MAQMSPRAAMRSSKVRAPILRRWALSGAEGHLDRVQVRRGGGQEQEPAAHPPQGVCCGADLVGGEVVQNDDRTWVQRGGELGLDPGREGGAVHRTFDDPGRDQRVRGEPCHEGLRPPAPERRGGVQALAPRRAASQPGHVGLHAVRHRARTDGAAMAHRPRTPAGAARRASAAAAAAPNPAGPGGHRGGGSRWRSATFSDPPAPAAQGTAQRGGRGPHARGVLQRARQLGHRDVAVRRHHLQQRRAVRAELAAARASPATGGRKVLARADPARQPHPRRRRQHQPRRRAAGTHSCSDQPLEPAPNIHRKRRSHEPPPQRVNHGAAPAARTRLRNEVRRSRRERSGAGAPARRA